MENIQNSLKFHPVAGKNIRFSDTNPKGTKRLIAERNEKSFCDGIVFSERPIVIYERIFIKILKLSSCWNGMIRFGFTSVNPKGLSTVRK